MLGMQERGVNMPKDNAAKGFLEGYNFALDCLAAKYVYLSENASVAAKCALLAAAKIAQNQKLSRYHETLEVIEGQ
jgi:hypothetical protein